MPVAQIIVTQASIAQSLYCNSNHTFLPSKGFSEVQKDIREFRSPKSAEIVPSIDYKIHNNINKQ